MGGSAEGSTKPVILLCEHLAPHIEAQLAEHANIVVADEPTEDAIVSKSAQAVAIIIRAKGKITRRVIESAPSLRVIGRHGIGVDHIDLSAAAERGIWVVNTPDANATATAEFAIGLILAVVRKIPLADRLVREQRPWSQADALTGLNLEGRTLGVVGVGRVGSRVAKTASQGFGMKVQYWDYRDREHEGLALLGATLLPLDRLLASADIVSLHVPSTPSTLCLLDQRRLRLMKPSAILINASRGAVIDEEALIDALRERRILGAGLDVMAREPLRDSALQSLDNVVLTPHIASYTAESFDRMGEVIWDVLCVLRGEQPRHFVVKPASNR